MSDGDAETVHVAPGVDQEAEVAPESKQKCSPRFLGFDPQGGVQLIGGLVIGLIALYSSYDHINLFGRVLSLNQQRGVCFIIASLAVVVIDAQLASRSRLRTENEVVESRERGARQEAARFRRARVEAEARQAQLAYLARPSAANREQLEQVLSKLSSSEVRALFEDQALERAVGLRP